MDAALSAESALFRWNFEPADTVKSMVFDVEWIGDGKTVSDVDRDFYRLYGRFAEASQFIRRVVEDDHLRYDVVVGSGSHGHIATFRVIGQRAREVAKGYAKRRVKPP